AAVRASAPPTPAPTPPASAGLRLVLRNPVNTTRIAVLSGERLSGPPDPRATTYGPVTQSMSARSDATVGVGGLAPGIWLHRVLVEATGQQQARQALVVDDPAAPSTQEWTLYGSVLRVDEATDDNDKCDASGCALREAVNGAARVKQPVLIVFDHDTLGMPAHVEVRDRRILIDTPGTDIDGTDAQGNPSPLANFSDRVFPVQITLRGTKQPTEGPNAVCPCRQNYAGTLFVAAADVDLVGLHVDRVYPPAKQICCGNHTLIEIGKAGRSARVDTCLLDGGGRALEDATTPKGNTGQATSKDCVKPEHTIATPDDPVVVTNSELSYCLDRGVKAQDTHLLLTHNWIHNNLRCALFSIVPKGDIKAIGNVIEEAGLNCPRGAPPFCEGQVVTRAEAPQVSAQGNGTQFELDGNIVRNGPLNGIFWQVGSTGLLQNSFVCGMGDAGILSIRQAGRPDGAQVRGSASVLNHRSGVEVRKLVGIDLGTADEPGRNAFAGNPDGAQVLNSLTSKAVIAAHGNQWESCYAGGDPTADACDLAAISGGDTNNGSGQEEVAVDSPWPHQSTERVTLSAANPPRVVEGGLIGLTGEGFDAVSGLQGLTEKDCANLARTNTCAPLHGTCVEFLVDGRWTAAADVLGVTPTFVMVRAPFTCSAPTRARVRRAVLGGGEVVSNELTICTN
ncbi:MAG: hypothetical protein SF182_22630, partial [Deltaproteobacteria bacterium]|nr:hypothetical protein [Deltaproteobacteria bacterium]